ncbi:TonB-dependent receptor-like protein [Tahibacter aquaticus]|uniref:TonB-dependent receptor-like protein n=1 Tax=Tahibacter aquaticus TaxID=520092 RepID=A0A4R6YM49_9GAMM|nr:carboxypeptidase regulatory-like domain-containing protein [Tahibacter aquaticus]TDR38251.1 TonB-dependent receptor-like protein [Tahibacter aquaticus]
MKAFYCMNSVLRARPLALSLALAAAFASGPTLAQKATGDIFGHTQANSSVSIRSVDTGLSREVQSDAKGRYVFNQLPTGRYVVSAEGSEREVTVRIGTGAEVDFAAKGSAELATIEVTGNAINPIDVSSVESATVFSAAQLAALPVGRDVTSVALLAPGTVRGDSSIGRSGSSLASFGGASVAENGYYINGFDVTNIRNFTSFASLPFEAIGEQQVKTGGYGAEFGRSLGGVINIVSKRGSNEFHAGVASYWAPESLREHAPNVSSIESPNNYYRYTYSDTRSDQSFNVYGSGPIIKDRLFFFAIAEGRDVKTEDFDENTSNLVTDSQPHGLVKLDWNITDSHILEFTGISNRDYEKNRNFSNDLDGTVPIHIEDPYSTRHNRETPGYVEKYGGEVYIGRYTGYLTDNLTLSAQYGELTALNAVRSPRNLPGADCPAVYDSRRSAGVTDYLGCWDENQFTIQDPTAPDERDRRRATRIDLDWQIGSHTVRGGYDAEKFDSTNVGLTNSGGVYYRYFRTGPNGSTVNGVALPGNTEYVRKRDYATKSGAYAVENTAFYLEDSWQIADRFLVYAGARAERFDNRNATGVSFAKSDYLYAPRLGFSWDTSGDATTKVFGNAGRYYIPIASNTNIRVSAAELFIHTFYRFDGVDPRTGAPVTLGQQIGTPSVVGDGTTPVPDTVTAGNLKPMYQDEAILGLQHAFDSGWTAGVRGVWRKVRNGMDDYCYHGAFYAWAVDNGYTDFDASTVPQCVILNPGKDAEFALDLNNDGTLTRVTIPARYFDIAEYQRQYRAFEIFWERPWDGKWSLQGSYTWARSRGNAEGYVNSSIGQGDAGITQDFDFPSFGDGAYGDLPNDRRHTLKLFGTYELAPQWRVAGNLLIQSGRPINCLGFPPPEARDFEGPDGSSGSGEYTSPSSFYCVSGVETMPDGTTRTIHTLYNRGSFGRTPWIKSIDFSVAWVPKVGNGDLTLKVDIFNVLNSQKVLQYNETGDIARGDPHHNPDFLLPDTYQAARSFRFTARYDFSL